MLSTTAGSGVRPAESSEQQTVNAIVQAVVHGGGLTDDFFVSRTGPPYSGLLRYGSQLPGFHASLKKTEVVVSGEDQFSQERLRQETRLQRQVQRLFHFQSLTIR